MNKLNLKSLKWVLITGATSGIGLATAELLAQRGFSLIITGRRQDRLFSLSQKLKSLYKVECEAFSFDIRDPLQINLFLEKSKALLPLIEVLINNAGLAKGTEKIQLARWEDWEQMWDTNVKGLFYLTRQIVPHMMARKKGHIINIGSVAGRWVYSGGAVYCATKFAVRAFSEGLRMDLLGENIRISNIEPGMAETEFSLVRTGSQEKASAVYQGMQPLKPKDLAETILWVIDRPDHVNIQELVIFPTDQAAVGLVHRNEV